MQTIQTLAEKLYKNKATWMSVAAEDRFSTTHQAVISMGPAVAAEWTKHSSEQPHYIKI